MCRGRAILCRRGREGGRSFTPSLPGNALPIVISLLAGQYAHAIVFAHAIEFRASMSLCRCSLGYRKGLNSRCKAIARNVLYEVIARKVFGTGNEAIARNVIVTGNGAFSRCDFGPFIFGH